MGERREKWVQLNGKFLHDPSNKEELFDFLTSNLATDVTHATSGIMWLQSPNLLSY